MKERLSWKEIVKKYPNQGVGLTEVKWVPGKFGEIKSAVVAYTGATAHDLVDLQIQTKGKVVVRDTFG